MSYLARALMGVMFRYPDSRMVFGWISGATKRAWKIAFFAQDGFQPRISLQYLNRKSPIFSCIRA